MKYLKTFEENSQDSLFLNEEDLKVKLLSDKDFAEGDVHQSLMNIAYDHLQKNNLSQDDFHEWIEENMGKIPLLAVKLGNYNYQVCNGGHSQYFSNGYASTESRGWASNYKNIDKHEEFTQLFHDLNMEKNLPLGSKVYDILNAFEINFDDEEECDYCGGSGEEECSTCEGNGYIECDECGGDGEVDEEECSNCDGNGTIDCGDCDGKGRKECDNCGGDGYVRSYATHVSQETTNNWSKLDDRWYEIYEDVQTQFNDYLKTLRIGGELIGDLIPFAEQTQKYKL